jgi:hypothetical protein
MVTINYREPKPMSKAWSTFLEDDNVEHESPNISNPADLVPYAFMSFEEKLGRANLKLAFSILQTMKAKIYNGQSESPDTDSSQRTSSNNTKQSLNSENSSHGGHHSNRKRPRTNGARNNDHDGDEDEESDDFPKRRLKRGTNRNGNQKRWKFACPYAKKLPDSDMSCKDITWPSIHRLKYVTFNRSLAPWFCQSCQLSRLTV